MSGSSTFQEVLVSSHDLNLSPQPSTTMASTSSTTIFPPTVEPKLEPLDETLLTQHRSLPDFFSSPLPAPFSDSTSTPLSQAAGIFTEEDNAYSEFSRASDPFSTPLSNRSQQNAGGDLNSETGAIVAVPSEEGNQAMVPSRSRRSTHQRSSELVRVTDLGLEDQRNFRDVVRRTRMIYDSLRVQLIIEEEKEKRADPGNLRRARARADLRAASIMRDHGLWQNRDKRIVGDIPGVYIGDVFFFRMELCVMGLHGQNQAGIDYVPMSQSSNGEPIATSVIVSGGYEDDDDAGDVIIYTGHGGQDKLSRQCAHQKLEGGNLALERSMHYGIEVRVIRGLKYPGSISYKVYVYDGLYKIVDCWLDVGKSGFGVYKFKLVRMDGQPEMGSSILKFAETLRTRPLTVRQTGYLTLDLSAKKEKCPIFLFNDIDDDRDPLYYEYLQSTVFPSFILPGAKGTGCDCVSGCTENCLCARKNGGDYAYDNSGVLLRGKPIVFECGKYCQCPPHCRNRVSQHGLKNVFEVFRSVETGWGVRCLELIQAGAFICEYTGVVLTREQAQILTMNGDSLVYPNRFTEKWAEWGDLSQIYSDYVRPTRPSVPLDFAMDVSGMRNVACYISHSSTPNVFVQFVLHDHNNLSFPRLMLFALENIPPLRELSLDYGVPAVADEWNGKLAICN